MPAKFRNRIKLSTARAAVLMTAAVLVVAGGVGIGKVRADQFDDQIAQVQAQSNQVQGSLNSLAAEAKSYQDAINLLQTQINAIQGQINANQKRQASLQAQITAAEKKIAYERKVLGEDLKTMYVEGQMSTIEELATSKSLSDYVDREAYRTAVQDKIQETLQQIAALQAQLKKQKAQVDMLITAEKKQNAQLGAAKSKQQQLLAYNQSQQDSYSSQLQANNSKIASLRSQQAAYYAAYSSRDGLYSYGSASNGGYPSVWANAPQDSMVDSWGMYNRECVSYAAWKEASLGRYVPYGLGNAADWAWRAQSYGIPVGTTPAAGTIVQWGANDGLSPLGHVAYVEAVNGDGSIEISQYNWQPGAYSRMHIPAYISLNLHYIHFQ